MDHLENSDPSQVWYFEGSTLKNKAANLWKSQDEWKFGQEGEMYYIENVTKKKVLGATNFGKVIEEDFEEDNLKQLWKKVDPVWPTTEGHFLFENIFSYWLAFQLCGKIAVQHFLRTNYSKVI